MLYNTKEDDFENVIICTVQQIKEDEFSIIWFTDDKKRKSDFKKCCDEPQSHHYRWVV